MKLIVIEKDDLPGLWINRLYEFNMFAPEQLAAKRNHHERNLV